MRALLIAKRSGREARITCLNQVRHLGFTAPDELRERFQRVSRGMLAAQVAALRPRPERDTVIYATKLAMRSLGRRVLVIDEEIARLDVVLGELVTATAPGLLGLYGVGVDTAAILCVASCSPASAPIPAPAPMSPAASTKNGRDPRSSASSSATSPGRPTDTSRANGSTAAGLAQELPDPAPAA